MVTLQSTGKRRFDITRLDNGYYEVRIIMTGSEKYIAAIVFSAEEWKKVYALQEKGTSS